MSQVIREAVTEAISMKGFQILAKETALNDKITLYDKDVQRHIFSLSKKKRYVTFVTLY